MEAIDIFLPAGSGYGSGYCSGDGSGDGSGSGYGSGSGNGYGSGSGHGYGNGNGNGNGNGIKKINSEIVYRIDNISTLIDNVKGNYAKGRILNSDLTLTPCYIAKCGDFFAHGETLHEAQEDAREKYERNLPVEERIRHFMEAYPTLGTEATHQDLFRWHNVLTGSCEMGRREWCKDHSLDPENGTMTVSRFIKLTKDSYGGGVIKQLSEAYTS